jgi:di/tricarboxylate transporter
MLGFMLPMWISNTATTAMMVPIVDAVLNELQKDEAKSTITLDTTVS